MNKKQKIVIIIASVVIMFICGVKLVSSLIFSNDHGAKNTNYDAGDYRYHLIPAVTEETSETPLGIVK